MRRMIFPSLAAILVIGLLPANAVAATCNRVAGGSQTSNWYRDGDFETLVNNDEWERMTRGGQSIPQWAIDGTGWSTRVRSSCVPTTAPTRFVLQVLPDHQPTLDQVIVDVGAALDAIPVMVPSATRITLIPPVGGDCPDVGLANVQPLAIQAIDLYVGGIVDAGPVVNVPDCAMFRDNAGHLTADGSAFAAQQFAAGL